MLDTKILGVTLAGVAVGVHALIAQVPPEIVDSVGSSQAAFQFIASNLNNITIAGILLYGVRWLDNRLKEKELESKDNIAAARERYAKRETDQTTLFYSERDKIVTRYEALLIAQQNRYDDDIKLLRSRHDATIVEIKAHFAGELLELKNQIDKLTSALVERNEQLTNALIERK